jgi:hypothetical protein
MDLAGAQPMTPNQLRSWQAARGLTQQQAAVAMGVSLATDPARIILFAFFRGVNVVPIIDIILDGAPFTSLFSWTLIPRAGEIVLLRNGDVWAKVTQVVWGDDSAAKSSGLDRQWIQILCKTISPDDAA